jgi:hypothetical protein
VNTLATLLSHVVTVLQESGYNEHFPEIASHPHHFHNPAGEVEVSPLTGDPERDLSLVMGLLFPPNSAVKPGG